jgi:hypothetical protein
MRQRPDKFMCKGGHRDATLLFHRGDDISAARPIELDLNELADAQFVQQALVLDAEGHRHRRPVQGLDRPMFQCHLAAVRVDVLEQ